MYQTISEAINSAKNPYFYVDVKNGTYNCGNKESYFSEHFPDDNFTFDVGNNKALCNMSEFLPLVRCLSAFVWMERG